MKLVAGAEPLRGVDDEQDGVAAFQRLVHFLHHLLVQRARGLVHAGRIDEDDLLLRAALLRAGTLTMPRMRLRVVCGLCVTMASFSPTSAFSSVDLPALGRPMMETNPERKDMGEVSRFRFQVSSTFANE